MAGPGQRVGTVQPGLVVTPAVGGPTAQEGLAAMQQAFKQGILNYDDILDGLTVKPAKREADLGELKAKAAKQKTDAANRPLRDQLERLQLEAQTADAGIAAGIASARAGTLTPDRIAAIGTAKADADVTGAKADLARIEAASREAHDKLNDPEGLMAHYRKVALEYGGEVRPGMTLDELRNVATAALNRTKQEKLDLMEVEARLKAMQTAGAGIAEQEGKLRAELRAAPEIKDYAVIYPSYRKVQQIAELDAATKGAGVSAADDMSLIFSYMKLLDPNSTVREGEYAAAEKTRGWTDEVRALYNKAWSGQKLDSTQRQHFAEAAARAVQPHKEGFDRVNEYYRRLARGYSVDPAKVVMSVEDPEEGVVKPEKPAPSWASQLPPSRLPGARPKAGEIATKPKTDLTLPPGLHYYQLKDGRVVRGRRNERGDILPE